MSQLFERLETARNNFPESYKDLPFFVRSGLNPALALREYQETAFRNFITYYENDTMREKPSQTLFHMATGSGKTLIMAGLILYLYKKGYRNFLFFVNSTNIIGKTKANFLLPTSPKYVFNDVINIDGEVVPVCEVNNFQTVDADAINISFQTIQGLFSLFNKSREDAVTIEDFAGQKAVLISDEAHHINVETKQGKKLSATENRDLQSWEDCINRIFNANEENVLLEFTATCDLANPFIQQKYENKIVVDYPLTQFRKDHYSKEVKTLQFDRPLFDRALAAILLSQYRFKLFQHNGLSIKPVVLFKSDRINNSVQFYADFQKELTELTSEKLRSVTSSLTNDLLQTAVDYFQRNKISNDELIAELQNEFGSTRSLIVNSKNESEEKQIIVNSLESPSNPYRAVFAVDQLNEGWDVLNLFDIVRTYSTRDSNNGKPGKTTIQEAQLIGRGARYCPFLLTEGQHPFKRKFDNDVRNPLRICETLFYHSLHNPQYIAELSKALRETGLFDDTTREIEYKLKPRFKETEFYLEGLVFANKRKEVSLDNVSELPPDIRNKHYPVAVDLNRSAVDDPFTQKIEERVSPKTRIENRKLSEIAYTVVHTASRKFNFYQFCYIQKRFPNVKTLRQFLTDENYMGGITVQIETSAPKLTNDILYRACFEVMRQAEENIERVETQYEGTKKFYARKVRQQFTDKTVHYNKEESELGKSQKDSPQEYQLDLAEQDWYAYEDCRGTSEEKRFLKFFAAKYDALRRIYGEVYVIRNERQLALYDFADGRRFEPDFLLFLRKKGETQGTQYQVFIEPKGEHLVQHDQWKEDFLQLIESDSEVIKLTDDTNLTYRIIGLPFYKHWNTKEFTEGLSAIENR
ncbi:MAG: DEAD/DEAH box helicase family protein [Planctomycetaceae bacterium]|jgi:type III restriction enzyme|nr:DEAD/DEAH box helicase family protein [Planctomycetaceae bacterium]